jgi:lipopolysaccharide/colanic/teichoic acid biosynthesis glycosyltransferase
MDVGWPPPAEGQWAKKEWGAVGGKGEAAAWGERPSDAKPSITTGSVDLTRSVPHFVPIDVGMWSDHVPGPYERYVKPVADRLGALILLVVAAPLILAASLAILVTMGRPVLLRQYRVGRHGKVFALYKFRTMTPDRRKGHAHYEGVDRRRTHKHPEDPRITPVGAFLRKWSLDELPQFWNVARGDMSLVGPRPELVDIVARYETWQHRRHAVKPGITCTWQVSERGDTPLHEATEVDLDYVDRVSLALDLRLLLITPLAALGLRRGY